MLGLEDLLHVALLPEPAEVVRQNVFVFAARALVCTAVHRGPTQCLSETASLYQPSKQTFGGGEEGIKKDVKMLHIKRRGKRCGESRKLWLIVYI